jgi:hypothetical protein
VTEAVVVSAPDDPTMTSRENLSRLGY